MLLLAAALLIASVVLAVVREPRTVSPMDLALWAIGVALIFVPLFPKL